MINSGETRVSIRGVWKLFGHNGKLPPVDLIRNKTKQQLREEHNLVLALKDVSFDVAVGETFVVMGLSGSGKSTLVRTLVRLIEPTYGEILVDGEDILKYDSRQLNDFRRKKIAMVFQHFGLLPHRSVVENAAWGLEVQGMRREEREARAREVLELVGLKGWEDYRPHMLSGGMQQRVGLARAMAADPEVLLMDEPFSGLDPLIRRDMQNELVRLQDQLQKTIIFITHDLSEALKLGSHIAIMRDGEVVQLGTPEEILAAPADDYVAEFVRDVRRSSVVTLRSLMNRPRFRLKPSQTPQEAMETMTRAGIVSSFAVDGEGKYQGSVNFQAAAEANQQGQENIEGIIMTDEYPVLSADASVESALPIVQYREEPLPLVDNEGMLVGWVRPSSVMHALVQEVQEVVEQQAANDQAMIERTAAEQATDEQDEPQVPVAEDAEDASEIESEAAPKVS
ncbi:MAG: glycine betaine/L-proline ABC transporter ATP-binding protein [Dehalococcoidia bacterium]